VTGELTLAENVVDAAAQALGLRETQLAADASTLREGLAALWTANYQTGVGDLRADLERMKLFFDPVATGARLRKAITALEPAAAELGDLPAACIVEAGSGRVLLTPEGRCALDILGAHRDDAGVIVIAPEELQEVQLILLELYQRWSRHRLHQVVGLLQGQHKPLQVPAAAVVLALLINRNTAPERALARAPERREQRLVDETFFPAVDAFAAAVLPSTRRSTDKESLIQGWRLHEATRRAPSAFSIEQDRIYIRPEHEDRLLELVAVELASREQVDRRRLEEGFDAMVVELRRRLPRLDTLGLAFERPLDTDRVRDRLLAHFDEARERREPDSAV